MFFDRTISEARDGRTIAAVGAGIVAAGLMGAAIASLQQEKRAPKISSRATVQAVARRIDVPEPYAPRAESDVSLDVLKAGIVWSMPRSGRGAVAASRNPALTRPVARARLVAAAPLPPRRPNSFGAVAPSAPEGPPVAVATIDPHPAAGFHMRRFEISGSALVRGIGGVGASIGNMGASLGRMMRLSSR